MNQLAEQTERLPMNSVGITTSGTGSKIAPQTLGEVVKFAEVMCRADIAIPKHLRGNAGACMAVSLQALDWQMNPFAVASKSYSVNGVIAYEAQLIVAVINTRSGIEGRLEYDFEGEGDERVCIARGKLDGKILDVRSPKFGKITPKNSPLWKSDPDQQHCYYTGRAWGRRHTPEVLLGIYDRDEAAQFGPEHARDVTPKPSVMERLRANANSAPQEPATEREGFSASSVQQQTDRVLSGEIVDDEPHDPETGEIIEYAASGAPPMQTPDDGESAPPLSAPPEPVAQTPSQATGSDLFGKFQFGAGELQHLKDFARKCLDDASSDNDAPAKEAAIERLFMSYREVILTDEGKQAMNAMGAPLAAVVNGKRSREMAADYIAREILDCPVAQLEGRRNG